MGALTTQAQTALRDYNVAGNPGSLVYSPAKSDLISLFTLIDQNVTGLSAGRNAFLAFEAYGADNTGVLPSDAAFLAWRLDMILKNQPGIVGPGTFTFANQVFFDIGKNIGSGLRIYGAGENSSIFKYLGSAYPAFRIGTDTLTGLDTIDWYNKGSGYTNGTYTNVTLTGGSGSVAPTANITVAGGVVTARTLVSAGTGNKLDDILSASTAVIGAGSGFQIKGRGDNFYSEIEDISFFANNPGAVFQFGRNDMRDPINGGRFDITTNQLSSSPYSEGCRFNSILTVGYLRVISSNNYAGIAWHKRGVDFCTLYGSASGADIGELSAPTARQSEFGSVMMNIDREVNLVCVQNSPVINGRITNAGSGYVNGTYRRVPMTGGTGTGLTADITVAGGVVVNVETNPLNVVSGYTQEDPNTHLGGDVLSASNTNLGGTGSGFTFTVSLKTTAAKDTHIGGQYDVGVRGGPYVINSIDAINILFINPNLGGANDFGGKAGVKIIGASNDPLLLNSWADLGSTPGNAVISTPITGNTTSIYLNQTAGATAIQNTVAGDAYLTNFATGRTNYFIATATGGHSFYVGASSVFALTAAGASVSGNLAVSGAATLGGTLSVAGTAVLGGPTTISNSLSVTGPTSLTGTVAADLAAAGRIGEFASSNVLVGSAVALTTGTPANVTSLTLAAGDWEIHGNLVANPAGTSAIANFGGGFSTTSGALPTAPGSGGYAFTGAMAAGVTPAVGVTLGKLRLNVSTSTTVYLVAQSSFTVSTNGAYGFMSARRIR